MNLGIVLILVGLACAVLVHWGLGVLLVLVGLVLLLVPQFGGRV